MGSKITDYQAKYFAHILTRKIPSNDKEKLITTILDAQVEPLRRHKWFNKILNRGWVWPWCSPSSQLRAIGCSLNSFYSSDYQGIWLIFIALPSHRRSCSWTGCTERTLFCWSTETRLHQPISAYCFISRSRKRNVHAIPIWKIPTRPSRGQKQPKKLALWKFCSPSAGACTTVTGITSSQAFMLWLRDDLPHLVSRHMRASICQCNSVV